jgi:hypothetical protein
MPRLPTTPSVLGLLDVGGDSSSSFWKASACLARPRGGYAGVAVGLLYPVFILCDFAYIDCKGMASNIAPNSIFRQITPGCFSFADQSNQG